ncbi:hypothetical protein KIN20_008930 [Parelaphostrongylus tenuis]|uniref:Uncharacterized protein n=1 Tax=Parelaphostrongylus tenuis TaxID=148309 RepID=A0AAD5MNE8_PARTN|nr:hypothetical protein KIN20_008930 [Parelaphostrongylus tenuis]
MDKLGTIRKLRKIPHKASTKYGAAVNDYSTHTADNFDSTMTAEEECLPLDLRLNKPDANCTPPVVLSPNILVLIKNFPSLNGESRGRMVVMARRGTRGAELHPPTLSGSQQQRLNEHQC